MNRDAIVHRRVCGYDDVVGIYPGAGMRLDAGVLAAMHRSGVRVAEDLIAVAHDGFGQGRQIPNRLELCLAAIAQTGPGVEGWQGRARHAIDLNDPGLSGNLQLVIECSLVIGRVEE
jgi:hypothetical protein